MATFEQIQAKIKKLEEQARALLSTKSQAALNKIRDLMSEHGLTTADIDAHVGKRRGPKVGAKAPTKTGMVAAKYRDPSSGATWSGRGRAPSWIASANDRTRFLVDEGTAVAGANKAKPVDNYPRGPQPAKYADPKTGATWSGRGRVPAWLASAKDKSKFLIGSASAETVASAAKTAVAKKASVKRVATKKAASKKAVVSKKAASKTGGAAGPVAKKVTAKKVAAKKVTTKRATREKAPSSDPVQSAQVAPTAESAA
ncbi:H-NS family nucleoid-associated regulatory protein [Paraburkholderia hospita]|uniref:H-NS family nucleoid-associated regulatory protein n=1 Tax=Paraburkholderia hospita TaxID=169430 RepID=UPI000B346EB2|nr:H-NS family nucleoid-associated regulatory protein [Paraburkholderia hospita]OUL74132.1 hypothetical protein CA603_42270 [Paraburkholderia hospita]